MSHQSILSISPGRDLDAAVALQVMDYHWLTHLLQFSAELAVKWLGTQQDLNQAGGVYRIAKPDEIHALKHRENFDEAVPCYSTDSRQAKAIIEKMTTLGFSYTVNQCDQPQLVYTVSFTQPTAPAVSAQADSLPAAVAKAALLAVTAATGQ